MIVLDCTLRDGGYYNKWKFTVSEANKYIRVMEKSKIDAIEIGFRSPEYNILGDFANVTDKFIKNHLVIPKVKYFGVMINNAKMTENSINEMFVYSDKSPINLVRVATHFKDIDLAERVCKDLKNLGYTVSCNLMQAASKSYDEIVYTANEIEKWKSVDILYLADSLGGMNHDAINYAYKAIKSVWSGLTGFHGHNNKGQSLDNSLEAIDIGVDWIDGTVLGMGRGPGNTEIEYLLCELNKRGFGEFELDDIFKLSLNNFSYLKDIYKWGPSLLYYLSAEYDIHPTYVQNLITDNYPTDKIFNSINYLKTKESNSFNEKLYMESINECSNNNPRKI